MAFASSGDEELSSSFSSALRASSSEVASACLTIQLIPTVLEALVPIQDHEAAGEQLHGARTALCISEEHQVRREQKRARSLSL